MTALNKFVVVPFEKYQILIKQNHGQTGESVQEINASVDESNEPPQQLHISPEPQIKEDISAPLKGEGVASDKSPPQPPPPGIPAHAAKKRKVPIKRNKHIWANKWKSW